MNKLLSILFHRVVHFGTDIRSYVRVTDSNKRNKKDDDLFCGTLDYVDFDNRTVVITELKELTLKRGDVHIIPFDKIVTLSRMKDGRLRMWLNLD